MQNIRSIKRMHIIQNGFIEKLIPCNACIFPVKIMNIVHRTAVGYKNSEIIHPYKQHRAQR